VWNQRGAVDVELPVLPQTHLCGGPESIGRRGPESAVEPRNRSDGLAEGATLVPPRTTQYTAVSNKIRTLQAEIDGTKEPFSSGVSLRKSAHRPHRHRPAHPEQAKFLFLGLTKAGTFFSMIVAFGVVPHHLRLEVRRRPHHHYLHHEMDTSPLYCASEFQPPRRCSFPASRLRPPAPISGQIPAKMPRVGLAGPLWGLGATIVLRSHLALLRRTPGLLFAQVSAWIICINLMPFWQLDGGRGFRALSKMQRWIACAALGLMPHIFPAC